MSHDPLPSDLGQKGYAAYGTATGGLTHDGRSMPPWEELGEDIQAAWTVTASAMYQAGLESAPRGGGR
ncbi:hypothetical protein [Streptomyces sp. Je 1-369]|uniref:hypothetical protein n=1 Tax=Streptomyces sp. Je 1-369 TaxID=2966192 RepID=UPI002286039B|nr:hypothetical protein [Streptomyces sp. Je 1-369]WAL94007.1 hypothetical protein NOO62_05510 [Streptomyces sp. Je 1-369]